MKFLSLLLILVTSSLIACRGNGVDPNDTVSRTPPSRGEWTIEEAQRFDEFALYWAGEEFRGVPLTEIHRFDTSKNPSAGSPENNVRLTYGTCEVDSGPFQDGSCSPPVQIILEGQGENYCVKSGTYRDRDTFRERAQTNRAEIESSRYVWTEDVAIKIYTDGQGTTPMDVANELVSLNGDTVKSPDDPLPAISVGC